MTPILAVRGLTKTFAVPGKSLWARPLSLLALDDVSIEIARGEVLGLVGESGSGKSTLGRAILRALRPDSGRIEVCFAGASAATDIATLPEADLRPMRARMQMVFQDPFGSLNPRLSVRDILADPLIALGLGDGPARAARVADISARCQIDPAHLSRFPHAFSGGQRQRIAIARALVSAPELLVCDEAVSALDVSVRAEILNLLDQLRRTLALTYLFITHDLSVVRHIADRVAVMYLGRIVEVAPTAALFAAPRHPYTVALLSAIPEPDPTRPLRPLHLTGDMPSPINPPAGCRFHTRCPRAAGLCRSDRPDLRAMSPGHLAACHYPDAPEGVAA